MTQYQKYLKDWTSERGITSYLGSDKPAFQRDWKAEKSDRVRFGEEMGREDINRAGEPFKKPKPKAKVPINIPKMWVFKPTKDNYGSTEVERRYLLNALPRDRDIAREGLYKNSQAEDFTVGDFKDAIDKTKKTETSPLLRIAKFLQKNDFGKIVYYK